jgi:hypothetical protein
LPSDDRSCLISADGRDVPSQGRPCEGARRCQAFSFNPNPQILTPEQQLKYDRDNSRTFSIDELDAFFQAEIPQERIPKPETRKPKPETTHPKPETQRKKPENRNPKQHTRNPKPNARNPKPETRNPKPETRNKKPETRNPIRETRTPKPLSGGKNIVCRFYPLTPELGRVLIEAELNPKP